MKRLRLVVVLTLTMLLSLISAGGAMAKIQSVDTSCSNPSGQEPGGQQPSCKNQNLTQESENQNPSGKAPPGQNP